MMDFGKWAFQNRKLVYFAVAVLLVGGLLSTYQMSKLEDPEVTVKMALVVTTYPGASAHQVEMEVTDPLEKSIRSMPYIDNVESYSYADLSLIQVELRSTVPNKDVEQCWDMLRRKAADAIPSLPEGASTPQVHDDFGNVYGIFYALTGDGLPMRRLGDYADMVQRELCNLEGVDRVSLYGKREECIEVTLLEDRMATLGVKPAEVVATFNGQNQTAYTGYFETTGNRIRVSVSDRFRSVEDISGMIVQGHTGDQLRLSDIAVVGKAEETPVRNSLSRDGQEAIGILVSAASGSDIVKVGKAVEKRIAELEKGELPAGVECHKVFYQPERVSQSLGTFVVNLAESVVIVVLILMLTMGLRSGVIIGVSLLVTVMGSFLLLWLTGGTMQRVSLAAFVLAMGMLVDNAIVIVDGILVSLRKGEERSQALTSIGRQTAMPLLGATLIAIIAFLPIFLSPDTAGIYVHDLFVVLAVSLLLSWLLALTHVPLMASRLLVRKKRGEGEEDKKEQQGSAYEGRVYRALRSSLLLSLRHRWSFVALMAALVVLSLLGYRYTKQGFFPDMVYDQLYIEYKLPEGVDPKRVKADLASIEDYLHTQPEVVHVTASTGGTPGRYNLVRNIANPSLAYGELIVDFTSPKTLERSIDRLQDTLSLAYPDAYVKLKRYNLMFKKYPIEAQFQGPDPAVLHRLSDEAMDVMLHTPEVAQPTTDWEPPVPVLTVEFNQPEARTLGLTRTDVSLSLLPHTGGLPVGSFHEGTHNNNIYVKATTSDGQPRDDLGGALIFSILPSLSGLISGETLSLIGRGALSEDELVERLMCSTPLRQVAKEVSVEWEDPVVPRYNGQRSQRVQCSPAPGIETEAARQVIQSRIESIPLPKGYTLTWQGERAASTRSMKYLFQAFPLAVILMVAILIMLFKDYRKPLIIFCCLPLILVGVVAVMLLTGKVFNFVAIVGTLGLMGMLIKNGIVLMDEISLEIAKGVEPVEALMASAQSRLRPVAMASLTTILGMIPLLSDDMFGSLAAAIMGGLLASTVGTLLLLPVLYALFFGIRPSRGDTPSQGRGRKVKAGGGVSLLIIVALTLWPCPSLRADDSIPPTPSAPLSFDDCVRAAISQGKKAQASKAATRSMLYQKKSLWANFFPDLSAEGAALYSNANGSLSIAGGNLPTFLLGGQPDGGFAYFPGTDIDLKIGRVFMGGVRLTQPIYTGGRIRTAYRMADTALRLTRLEEQRVEEDIVEETASAYANLMEAKEMVVAALAYRDALLALHADVEKALSHGLAQRADLMKVEVKVSDSELSLLRARNAVTLASMNLCRVIGLPLSTPLGDEAAVSPDVPEEYGALSLTGSARGDADLSLRPEYGLASGQVDLAEQQVRLDRADKLPQVLLSGNYEYMNGVKVAGRRFLDKAYFTGMLGVSVPLYHFGGRINRERAARAKAEEASLNRQEIVELMELELAQAEANAEEADMELALSQRKLREAEEELRLSLTAYRAQTMTLTDCLEAHASHSAAMAEVAQGRWRDFTSRIHLLRASGALSQSPR